jgi:hypothetical protein
MSDGLARRAREFEPVIAATVAAAVHSEGERSDPASARNHRRLPPEDAGADPQ